MESQVEGMFKLINIYLKGVKDFMVYDPEFAMKQLEDLEKILNIFKETALTHENIVNKILEAKMKGGSLIAQV